MTTLIFATFAIALTATVFTVGGIFLLANSTDADSEND